MILANDYSILLSGGEPVMKITRYDGTRFITEEEIDQEFTGQWVLITINHINANEGYLIPSLE